MQYFVVYSFTKAFLTRGTCEFLEDSRVSEMKFVACDKRILGIILSIIIRTELAQQVPSCSLQINIRGKKNSKSVSICDS